MHVRMYVGMYVRMYVCMYVCTCLLDANKEKHMYVCMNENEQTQFHKLFFFGKHLCFCL